MTEAVDHPQHYNAHPSGIECIDVVEHMGFNVGNAMKYLWRADEKGRALEDLRKAAWYVQREIEKRERESPPPDPTDPTDLRVPSFERVTHIDFDDNPPEGS